jgi:hypothetical protein
MVGGAVEPSVFQPSPARGRIAAEVAKIVDAVEVQVPDHGATLAPGRAEIETAKIEKGAGFDRSPPAV